MNDDGRELRQGYLCSPGSSACSSPPAKTSPPTATTVMLGFPTARWEIVNYSASKWLRGFSYYKDIVLDFNSFHIISQSQTSYSSTDFASSTSPPYVGVRLRRLCRRTVLDNDGDQACYRYYYNDNHDHNYNNQNHYDYDWPALLLRQRRQRWLKTLVCSSLLVISKLDMAQNGSSPSLQTWSYIPFRYFTSHVVASRQWIVYIMSIAIDASFVV